MSSYVDLADNASGADPSGFLSAGVAAVKLVGAVAKVAPHVSVRAPRRKWVSLTRP